MQSLLPVSDTELKSLMYAAMAALLMWCVRELQYRQRKRHEEKQRRIRKNLARYTETEPKRVHSRKDDRRPSKPREDRPGDDKPGGRGRASIFPD